MKGLLLDLRTHDQATPECGEVTVPDFLICDISEVPDLVHCLVPDVDLVRCEVSVPDFCHVNITIPANYNRCPTPEAE